MAEVITRFKVDTSQFDPKIKNAKNQINGLGSSFGQLDKVLGTSIAKFATIGAAVAGAVKVMGDALKRNEQFVDDWGRACEVSGSLYNGFLDALNTGDISGYLSNINNIVTAAQEAYDALDNLNTMNAFNQVNQARLKAEYTQAVANYKNGTGTKEQVEAAANAYKKLFNDRQQAEKDTYRKKINKLAEEKGANADMLYELFSTKSYDELLRLKSLGLSGTEKKYSKLALSFGGVSTFRQGQEVSVAATEEERIGQILSTFNDTLIQEVQALGAAQYVTAEQIATIDKQTARYLGGEKESKPTVAKAAKAEYIPAEGSIDAQAAKVAELNKQWMAAADPSARKALKEQLDSENAVLDKMKGNVKEVAKAITEEFNEPAEGTLPYLKHQLEEAYECLYECRIGSDEWKESLEGVKNAMEAVNAAQKEIDDATNTGTTTETAKDTGKAWGAAANALLAVSSAMQQLEDPAAKVAGIVGQAVATIALSFAQAMASPATGAAGVFGWIAAAAAGVGTMIATIESIKSVTSGFAEGGMVLPNGSVYSGDNIVARLNAGEGVLTAEGIRNAERMASNSILAGGIRVYGRLSGKDILLSSDNYNRSAGGSRGVYGRIR